MISTLRKNHYSEALKLGHELDDKYVRTVAFSLLGITSYPAGKTNQANPHHQEVSCT